MEGGAIIPPKHLIPGIPHILQSHHWDCGVACAAMLVRYAKPEYEIKNHTFDEERKKLGIPESVWTIDVAHLMAYMNIKHLYHTVTLGVDPAYSDVDFYTEKGDLGIDFSSEEDRINSKFSTASEKGINVQKRSVSQQELLERLSQNVPSVVLVDANIQRCLSCERQLLDRDICCFQKKTYQGHFVVLCGYDIPNQQFFYKNPSFLSELCSCTFDNFDEARKALGTDEDILFVMK